MEKNWEISNNYQKEAIQEIDQTDVDLFKKLVLECWQNNIKAILVFSPEYIESQNRIENRTQIIEAYQYLANFTGATFINFSGDSVSYNKNLFYNSQHLNSKGSELFSTKLVGLLKCIFSNKIVSSNFTTIQLLSCTRV